ncbi:ribonuclease 3 isoform X2 [Ischnura elegans]|uniref:ribonuclease 3 isoform X2 n=1 Tax=Ischnura elegans TaxID=197161 RepID=UPI001ED8AD32|nr:ribonuclease 3 isoform X2 [Ischnura elegans]
MENRPVQTPCEQPAGWPPPYPPPIQQYIQPPPFVAPPPQPQVSSVPPLPTYPNIYYERPPIPVYIPPYPPPSHIPPPVAAPPPSVYSPLPGNFYPTPSPSPVSSSVFVNVGSILQQPVPSVHLDSTASDASSCVSRISSDVAVTTQEPSAERQERSSRLELSRLSPKCSRKEPGRRRRSPSLTPEREWRREYSRSSRPRSPLRDRSPFRDRSRMERDSRARDGKYDRREDRRRRVSPPPRRRRSYSREQSHDSVSSQHRRDDFLPPRASPPRRSSYKDGHHRSSRSQGRSRRESSLPKCRPPEIRRPRSPKEKTLDLVKVEAKETLEPKGIVDTKKTDKDGVEEHLLNWRKGLDGNCSNNGPRTNEEMGLAERCYWTRAAPAELYYHRDENIPRIMRATNRLAALCDRFDEELVQRAEKARQTLPKVVGVSSVSRQPKLRVHRGGGCGGGKSSSSSGSDSSSEDADEEEEDRAMEELQRKRLHPHRLHPELWYNDSGEMNDGPLCRCSAKARRSGIRHGIYAGEGHLEPCSPDSNNADRLHHYRITISPPTNFLIKTPTIIRHDGHEFIFEGFSMLSHFPLQANLPTCKVIRFNIEYTILYIEEKLPENFTVKELDLFYKYLFSELLELVDLDFKAAGDDSGCPRFHFMPRFVRDLPDNGKEILSMNEVLFYLLKCNRPLIDEESQLANMIKMPQFEWQNFADEVKGMVVTYPGMKPCSVRVDQLDRDQTARSPDLKSGRNEKDGLPKALSSRKSEDDAELVKIEKDEELEEGELESKPMETYKHPEIVHFGIRPPQLSYAGNPDYQKAWREYVKFRHLLANMPKPSFEDKRKLEAKENRLQEMRTQSKMKRDVTVAVSGKGFYRTGVMCDVIQHAMLIPVLVCHLRFHRSLDKLETSIGYKFHNRYLLQLALTHPSYRENFGTNPDHARNSLTNCGIRQPEYGDRRIHYMNTRKRGINTLINIMSRFGKKEETESNITHNERLEFLGDAVVEFLTSIHLFHMFPDLEEGGLATYRAAIVQNQHLAVLAKTLHLEDFMLYAHGSDLCHDLELRHAMANCFEALMGALFLDGGIDVADKVFAETLFKTDEDLLDVWVNYPLHPLQDQEPSGDRKWITSFPLLQKLVNFEDSIGVEFKHIRLLARAFTDRSIGYNNLTLGSNQRLEFLGDTVLQLIASEYLYKFFPEHHEGHLSLLRSSLVNNRTQAVVCDDLGMTAFALYSNPKAELKTKDRADLLEAFLGALYVDKGLEYCLVFCHVCFFPRLQDFIMNQDWNDPKSKLQQCCLTLRTMDGGEPDIPIYKVIECKGPTNTRVYTVAVYFRGQRLAKASGHSIQQAEMNAAKVALEHSQDLFPQLDHQKRVIAKSMKKQQRWPQKQSEGSPIRRHATPVHRSSMHRNPSRDKGLVTKKPEHRNEKKVVSKRRRSESCDVRKRCPEKEPQSKDS